MKRQTIRSVPRTAWRSGVATHGTRSVPEETAVALTFGGTTHAVMMATPADLIDFAYGFSLCEEIITSPEEILSVEVQDAGVGIDLQIALAASAASRLKSRRRMMAGPVGCGLCGVESIDAAMRRLPEVISEISLAPAQVGEAIASLPPAQQLNAMTQSVHAAGLYVPGRGLVAIREDVGRHNALDKLIGALARSAIAAGEGAIVVTSRLSVEMVQKTALCGSSLLIAVSAPTALAIDAARSAGITLIALARGADFDVYTHERRIAGGARSHVA
jgi:FdhD protein